MTLASVEYGVTKRRPIIKMKKTCDIKMTANPPQANVNLIHFFLKNMNQKMKMKITIVKKAEIITYRARPSVVEFPLLFSWQPLPEICGHQ